MDKVVFVIGVFGGGGGERNCFNLANDFVARGVDVTVIAVGLKDPKYLSRFDKKVTFINLGKNHLRSAIVPLVLALKNLKPNLVLAFNHYVAAGLQLVRLMPGFNYKLYMRGIIGLTKKYQMNTSFWQTKIARPIIEVLIRSIDGVINQCIGMEEDVVKYWGIRPERSCVINNPVSKEIEAQQSAWTSLGKKNQLLYVGRLAAEKRVDILLHTLKKLRLTNPDLRLVIIGEGPLENELKRIVEDLGLGSDVDFVGYCDSPIRYYQESKVTLLASFSEGFPNVLIESLTLGVPVVAFDCETGPSEIVNDGVNGFLIPLGDVDLFQKATELALRKDWSFDVKNYKSKPILDRYYNYIFKLKD